MTLEDVKELALKQGYTELEVTKAQESFKNFKTHFFAGMITLEAAYVAGHLLLGDCVPKKETEKGLEGLI